MRPRNGVAVFLIAVGTVGCSTAPLHAPGPVSSIPSSRGIYKIGQPYQIDGTWYYPREQPDYDETGIASWYAPASGNKQTANGEIFDANALTAAHRTLPMPVNVRVTNLENGRSLVVRVNDRGPFARSRIIDVSAGTAKLLGFYGKGTARVRVTFVGPAELPGADVPSGAQTPAAIATALPAAPVGNVQIASLGTVPGVPAEAAVKAESLPEPGPETREETQADLQPDGKVIEVPVPAVTHLYVQAGAFTDYRNARRLKVRLAAARGIFISPIDRNGERFYRVRVGPFDDVGEADAALADIVGLGGTDARIVVDQ